MISRGRIGLRVRSITSFESGTPADVKAMVDLLVLIEAVDKIERAEHLDRLKATAHEVSPLGTVAVEVAQVDEMTAELTRLREKAGETEAQAERLRGKRLH